MYFPHTKATQLTERIMARVKAKRPDITTTEYNQIFGAVYDELNALPGFSDEIPIRKPIKP